jgi:MFS family permease
MRNTLAATWPVLLGMGVLMLGAGLQGTLTGVRATLEQFPTFTTGLVMASYYVGYSGGSLVTPALVHRVGHIRVFAALTAMACATILLQGAWIDPTVWAGLRLLSGFCFAGIYVVVESWLNERATNEYRGSLLAIYMVILYGGMGVGQFLLNLSDPSTPYLFMLVAGLISIALVPMALSATKAPEITVPQKLPMRELYRLSPLGTVAVAVAGMVSGTLFGLGPVYAGLLGMEPAAIANFMAANIVAAVFTQWPVGRLSDRVERRSVLVGVCLLSAAVAVAAVLFGEARPGRLTAFAAMFGGLALTLYSLACSNLNDLLDASQRVSASSTIILVNGAGAVLGPILISALMQPFGPDAYFGGLAVLLAALGGFGLWRKRQRAPVPAEQKSRFVTAQPQSMPGQLLSATVAERNESH